LAVSAGGHDGSVEPCLADCMHVADRAVVRVDAVAPQEREHQLVLAVPEAMNSLRRGRVAWTAPRQLDSARGEEGAHTVVTRLTVDVPVVVSDRIEGDERIVGLFRALF